MLHDRNLNTEPQIAVAYNTVPPVTHHTGEQEKQDGPAISDGADDTNNNVERLAAALASWFVRRDGRFYLVERLNSSMTRADAQHSSVLRFREEFPDVELTSALLTSVFKLAITDNHTEPRLSVPIWNGSTACRPDQPTRHIYSKGTVTVNSWATPSYRTLGVTEQSWGPIERFLQTTMPRQADRDMFLSWVSWALQNEADKPAWAPVLYSRRKGTGKSTLCQLLVRLFGQDNSIVQNNVNKLTQQFNRTMLISKLVISEEVDLKQGSSQSNTLKTLITEKGTTTEAKGKEVEKLDQCCCFVLTTNHLPTWIEPHERRYWVIEVDHDGHAAGPKAQEFGELVAEVNEFMADDENLARLYNALMAYRASNSFNPKALNVAALDSPIMTRLGQTSQQVVQEQLEELLLELNTRAIGQSELLKYCRERLRLQDSRLTHMMQDLGWRNEKAKWGGVDYQRALYVHPDYQVDRGKVVGPQGDEQIIGVPAKPNVVVELDAETSYLAASEGDY